MPELKRLSLIDKALLKRARNLLRAAEILVVTFALTGKKRVDGMMEIVTPHGVKSVATAMFRKHQLLVIFIGFGNHADCTAKLLGQRRDVFFDLGQNVAG